MIKALFITAVTIIVTIIPFVTVAFCFMMIPIVYCGSSTHSLNTPWWLITLLITSAILTFPLGWLAMWLGGLNFFPVGVFANGILWGQLLASETTKSSREANRKRTKGNLMNRFTFVSLVSLMLFFVLITVLGCTFMVGYGLNSGVGGGVHLTSPLLNGLLVASAILTFPLGWLSLGLVALFDDPLPILGGALANCILWAQLLWKFRVWRQGKGK